MSGFRQPTMRVGGDIRTARFVKLSTTENKTLLEADAGDFVIGISSEGAQDAPVDGASTLAGAAGDMMEWHGLGETCLLKVGSGGLTCGDLVASDGDGQGVTAAAGDKYGAIALVDAAQGELAEVMVLLGELET